MLIQLLHVYLLVALLLLPGSKQRSLNADHLQHKNETAKENAESTSPLKEVGNFVDGQCPPSTHSLKVINIDEKCQHECRNDVDCIEDYRCCEDGCSLKCTEPWFPNKVVDWTESPLLNQMPDGLELPDQTNGLWKSRGEPCSTTVLDGLQPLRCPTNHMCRIIMDGDIQLNIPNRGECVRINDKKSASEITKKANNEDFLLIDVVCHDKEDTYKHKEKFRKDCNICVCHNGVVFCDNQPCPSQIGIPASITNYEEHRDSTQFFNIEDKEEDTEGELRASGSGNSGEGEEARVTIENIKLGANTEGQNKEKSGNGKSTQEAYVSSGDDDEQYLEKVNGRENNDDESSGDVIDLKNQENVNNQDFGGESGSGELETKAPTTTEPAIATKTSESTVSARETSTSSPEISTFTREITTPAPKSSTLLPNISTASSKVEYRKTESLKLTKTTPTVGTIVLISGDYEPSGKYSGDDKEGSEEGSGESSLADHSGEECDTEEKQHPPPVYPDTIVLTRAVEAIKDSEFGFETDDARTDTINAGSLNSEQEVRPGNDGAASGNSVDKDDVQNTKQRGETQEYLQTTDDEN